MAPNRKIYALKRIKLQGRDAEAATGFIDEITLLQALKGKSNIIQLIDAEARLCFDLNRDKVTIGCCCGWKGSQALLKGRASALYSCISCLFILSSAHNTFINLGCVLKP